MLAAMTGSPPASVPTWIVEVTRHRDLSQEALELALEHMGGRAVTLLLVHVMSEVPTSRNMTLPASEVDPKTALQHAKKLVDILMKPLLATATANRVACGTAVELNDRREMGLCLAARRANADRVYIGVKRCAVGGRAWRDWRDWAGSISRSLLVPPWERARPPAVATLPSPIAPRLSTKYPSFPPFPNFPLPPFRALPPRRRKLLGWSSSGVVAACQTSLPRACTLVVSQGGRGHKHQQLIGAQRTDLSALPSVFLQFHSAPSANDALAARLAPPALPPATPSSLKPPACASPLHVRRPSDPPPLEPSASPLGSSGAPSSEFSLSSSSSSGAHSRSLPLAAPAPAPAPPAFSAGGEAAERDPWGQEMDRGKVAEQRRAGAGGERGRQSRLSFSTLEELQQMAVRESEASGAQPMSSAARHRSPGAAAAAMPARNAGWGEAALRGAGGGAGMGLSLSAHCSPSATPAPEGGLATGGGGEEGLWGTGHAVRKRSAERVALPEGIPEEGEGGGAAEDEGGEKGGEGAGEGEEAAWVGKGVSSNREMDASAAGDSGAALGDGREVRRGGKRGAYREASAWTGRQAGRVGVSAVGEQSRWCAALPAFAQSRCSVRDGSWAGEGPLAALSPVPLSPLGGSFRGSAHSPAGSSAGGSRQGSRQGSIEGVAGGGVGVMSGGGSVGAGDSSGTAGLFSRPAPTSSSSSSRSSRFHHLSAPSKTSLAAYSQGPMASQPAASSFGRSAFSSGQLTPGSMGAVGDGFDCRQFTAQQLTRATGNYAQENLLGKGSFGAVFRGEMLGCQVAVKRLEGQGWQGPDEFRVEVEVLSRMRHPHIVLLMGCCTEEMALVYEFLPGGTLQEKLGPPKTADAVRLSWSDRLRICGEMATALMYLHRNDPPIVHRDLKPDNILLDGNLASKIGDVGLARLLEAEGSTTMKVRGTLGYIDPEEVETCEISVLSDVYALGLIMLQLLTGQRAVKAVHRMLAECAKHAKTPAGSQPGPGGAAVGAVGVVSKYLESTGGEWRMDLAEEAAGLALRCADRRRENRPSLKREVQPSLVRIAAAAEEEVKARKKHSDSQFICPLSKEVMRDPVVAGDGFTYEREHITRWMTSCTLSPSTGQPLPHTCLTPNNNRPDAGAKVFQGSTRGSEEGIFAIACVTVLRLKMADAADGGLLLPGSGVSRLRERHHGERKRERGVDYRAAGPSSGSRAVSAERMELERERKMLLKDVTIQREHCDTLQTLLGRKTELAKDLFEHAKLLERDVQEKEGLVAKISVNLKTLVEAQQCVQAAEDDVKRSKIQLNMFLEELSPDDLTPAVSALANLAELPMALEAAPVALAAGTAFPPLNHDASGGGMSFVPTPHVGNPDQEGLPGPVTEVAGNHYARPSAAENQSSGKAISSRRFSQDDYARSRPEDSIHESQRPMRRRQSRDSRHAENRSDFRGSEQRSGRGRSSGMRDRDYKDEEMNGPADRGVYQEDEDFKPPRPRAAPDDDEAGEQPVADAAEAKASGKGIVMKFRENDKRGKRQTGQEKDGEKQAKLAEDSGKSKQSRNADSDKLLKMSERQKVQDAPSQLKWLREEKESVARKPELTVPAQSSIVKIPLLEKAKLGKLKAEEKVEQQDQQLQIDQSEEEDASLGSKKDPAAAQGAAKQETDKAKQEQIQQRQQELMEHIQKQIHQRQQEEQLQHQLFQQQMAAEEAERRAMYAAHYQQQQQLEQQYYQQQPDPYLMHGEGYAPPEHYQMPPAEYPMEEDEAPPGVTPQADEATVNPGAHDVFGVAAPVE
ncbi:unnamed protein product [Closterium sp. Naga37s-1]|nr:unnamed protein product [Closterium sp. Naga37s-1]